MLPVAQFNRFVNSHKLFTLQSKILAAVSGGVDSVLMVHLLKAAGYNFAIAHCNFQLRGQEANHDEDLCRHLAQTMHVPFFSTRFDTAAYAEENKLSVQMAARDLRYAWFERVRQQNDFDVIAVAHHQNDIIETMLLNLTRGTGIAGLHGIRAKHQWVVRPLLWLNRNEVADIAAQQKISYREDSSNSSDKYARNKIRHQVVPALKELNPSLEQTFAREADHFAELEQLLNIQLARLQGEIMETAGSETRLNLAAVVALVPQQLLLYGLLSPFGFTDTTVGDIIASLGKHAGRIFNSISHRLVLDREYLMITPLATTENGHVEINPDTNEIIFGNYKITIRSAGNSTIIPDRQVAAVDAAKLQFPLVIRSWQQGDTFYPLGMKTRKKLSDLFIAEKIPLLKKSAIPILVNGNNEIIWVCGYRISDRYKITAATKKMYIFELTEV